LCDHSNDSGPRCVAAFDYEGEEEDELTFSQGDVIALLELLDGDWGRGRIHGREGIFPLGFTEVVEALPQSRPDPGSARAVFDFTAENQDELTLKVCDWRNAGSSSGGGALTRRRLHRSKQLRPFPMTDNWRNLKDTTCARFPFICTFLLY
uniref:SH3 domain-containing protein n=1 Tax=Salarias fasciatus TaxID=181472 RepID=A0A672JCR5_SALFA